MNTKLLIGIIFAIIMFVILFFSESIMGMINKEGFTILDAKKDTLNFEF